MMWFLWSCFWAVGFLFEEGNLVLCYLWSSMTFHWYFPWESFSLFCNGRKKNKSGKQWKTMLSMTHFKGGCGRWSWEHHCSPGVCNSVFSALFGLSITQQFLILQACIFQACRSPTCTNVIPSSSLWLNHTGRKTRSYLPTLLQAAQSTMAQLKGSWEPAREQQAVEPKLR